MQSIRSPLQQPAWPPLVQHRTPERVAVIEHLLKWVRPGASPPTSICTFSSSFKITSIKDLHAPPPPTSSNAARLAAAGIQVFLCYLNCGDMDLVKFWCRLSVFSARHFVTVHSSLRRLCASRWAFSAETSCDEMPPPHSLHCPPLQSGLFTHFISLFHPKTGDWIERLRSGP